MTRAARILLAALCASPCLPGQIIVVDGAGGPGSSFTDIQSAIDAASPAAQISVRPGLYAGFTLDKALSLNGEDGALITTPNAQGEAITLRNLPAGTNTVVANFWLALSGGGGITVESSPGRVLLDELLQLTRGDVRITDCALLVCNRSRFVHGVHRVRNSRVTLAGCTFRGRSGATAAHGLTAEASEVTLSRCLLVGGSAGAGARPGAALVLTGSQAVVTGDGSGVLAVGAGSGEPPASAIEGSGTLVLDPDVVLLPSPGAPDVAASVATASAQIPSLAVSGTALGELASVDVFGASGVLYVVLLGRLSDPVPFPALGGAMWMDPNNMLAPWFGTLDGNGRATHTLGIFTTPGLFGLPVAWIALVGPGPGTMRFSNNAGFTYWL